MDVVVLPENQIRKNNKSKRVPMRDVIKNVDPAEVKRGLEKLRQEVEDASPFQIGFKAHGPTELSWSGSWQPNFRKNGFFPPHRTTQENAPFMVSYLSLSVQTRKGESIVRPPCAKGTQASLRVRRTLYAREGNVS